MTNEPSEEFVDMELPEKPVSRMKILEKSTPFLCLLGWHKVKKIIGFDGCSYHGICVRCGKECLQDSQGGWS